MTLGEQYYMIAMDDLAFLEAAKAEGYYNQPASLCQQITEKILKSIVADYYTDADLDDVLKSHSLKRIALAVKKVYIDAEFDIKALAYLSDFYYDTRYPGPDYIKIDRETFEECLEIMHACRFEADKIRNELMRNFYGYKNI